MTPSKENAKEAILAMVRADITYNDLLAEGIKVQLLDALFTELKIPLPKPVVEPAEILDPAMERKDRIAKLLAAKKSNSAAASPKEPVQPIGRLTTPELAARKKSPSPLPVRQVQEEHNVTDFSIPGLFMTSAEQEELLPSIIRAADLDVSTQVDVTDAIDVAEDSVPIIAQDPVANPVVIETSSVSASQEVNAPVERPAPHPQVTVLELQSLKRGPEPFSSNVMPQPKRQISTMQGSSPLADAEKLVNHASAVGRSKVNQNILKDRMAALKADLLRKNSRKKDLQDTMPALDAEVEKTRELLQGNEGRLRSVRDKIEDASAELVRLREEETQLLDDIRRLRALLKDGESGQQQFSKELTQLNDQIMADENETGLSQNSRPFNRPQTADSRATTQPTANISNVYEPVPSSLVEDTTERVSSYEQEDHAKENIIPRSWAYDDKEPTKIEYLPDQENVDRQLSNEIAYSTSNPLSVRQNFPSYAPVLDAEDSAGSAVVEPMSPEVEAPEADSDDDRMSIDESGEVESIGSASMSDSGSDEYEPPVHFDTADQPEEEDADDYEPQEDTLASHESSNDAEPDDYEPSEQVNVLNVDALDVLRRDEDDQTFPTTDESINDNNPEAVPPTDEVTAFPSPPRSERKLDLKPSAEILVPHSATMMNEPLSNARARTPSVQFVPYASPLSNMKPFRFNAQFSDLVKEGYRSLTYSHQIDKDVPLCPTELSGLQCTDGDCEEQHFRRIALSGTSNPTPAG